MVALSESETKMLEKLRKHDAALRRFRWPLLVLHAGLLMGAFWLLVTVANFPDEPRGIKTLVASHYLTPIYIMLLYSAGWVGYLIFNWNGNPRTVLLLKLLEKPISGSRN
jgi:hypothetical protein